MRFTTYSKFVPGLADAVNLQALLDQLGDFLLQSGFAGSPGDWPWWADPGDGQERSMDALKDAILRALMESGQLTPEMVKFLRGESSGDPERDRELERQVAELLDRIVQRLMEEGYLNVKEAPQVPEGYTPMFGPGGMAESAARQVQFNLTEKGMDFLGYKTLKNLLGSIGKSSMGAHETPHLATGVETEGASKLYEFGDVLNLDVPATLASALAREGIKVPLPLEYRDLQVHQSEYRSSAATVLMLACSHSMILSQYPGDTKPRTSPPEWRLKGPASSTSSATCSTSTSPPPSRAPWRGRGSRFRCRSSTATFRCTSRK